MKKMRNLILVSLMLVVTVCGHCVAEITLIDATVNRGISSQSPWTETSFSGDLLMVSEAHGSGQKWQIRLHNPNILNIIGENHVVIAAEVAMISEDEEERLQGFFNIHQILVINEANPITWSGQSIAGSDGFQTGPFLDNTPIQNVQALNILDVTEGMRNWTIGGDENLGFALKPSVGCEHHIHNTAATRPFFAIEHELSGDSNFDGIFNSGDLVVVFTAGKYDTGQPATFDEGDWNLDGVFDSGDLVFAFQGGHYNGGNAALAADLVEYL